MAANALDGWFSDSCTCTCTLGSVSYICVCVRLSLSRHHKVDTFILIARVNFDATMFTLGERAKKKKKSRSVDRFGLTSVWDFDTGTWFPGICHSYRAWCAKLHSDAGDCNSELIYIWCVCLSVCLSVSVYVWPISHQFDKKKNNKKREKRLPCVAVRGDDTEADEKAEVAWNALHCT